VVTIGMYSGHASHACSVIFSCTRVSSFSKDIRERVGNKLPGVFARTGIVLLRIVNLVMARKIEN